MSRGRVIVIRLTSGLPAPCTTLSVRRGCAPLKPRPAAVAVGSQPTTVTGEVTFAVAPLWAVNVPLIVGAAPEQRSPAFRSPRGPPLTASWKLDSGTSGRPLSVFWIVGVSATDALSVNVSGPPSASASPGSPPFGTVAKTGPLSGAGRSGERTLASPTCESAGQAPVASWSLEQRTVSAARFTPTVAGSVTVAELVAASPGCWVMVVESGGWAFRLVRPGAPRDAAMCGANGRLAQSVGVK